jgi:hypothetical protein
MGDPFGPGCQATPRAAFDCGRCACHLNIRNAKDRCFLFHYYSDPILHSRGFKAGLHTLHSLLPQRRQDRSDSLGPSFPDKFNHDFLADLFPANGLDQTPHVRDCVSRSSSRKFLLAPKCRRNPRRASRLVRDDVQTRPHSFIAAAAGNFLGRFVELGSGRSSV